MSSYFSVAYPGDSVQPQDYDDYSAVEAYAEASPDGEGHRFTRIDLLVFFYVKFLKIPPKE